MYICGRPPFDNPSLHYHSINVEKGDHCKGVVVGRASTRRMGVSVTPRRSPRAHLALCFPSLQPFLSSRPSQSQSRPSDLPRPFIALPRDDIPFVLFPSALVDIPPVKIPTPTRHTPRPRALALSLEVLSELNTILILPPSRAFACTRARRPRFPIVPRF